MTSEKDIENAFVKYAEGRGVAALKLRIDGQNGFPDRTLILPGGKVAFLEFKKPGGRLSMAQRKRIEALEAFGHSVAVVDSLEKAINFFEMQLNWRD